MGKQSSSTPLKLVSPSSTSNPKWYTALTDFFQRAGLLETIRGFEADLLVLSRAQHERLPPALQSLIDELGVCEDPKEEDYEELHVALLRDDLVEDATPAQQAKSKMKTFINRKRKLVNQSNQQEYTRKRQNTGEDANGIYHLNKVNLQETSARTDAIKIDRTSQIKHDTILHQESPHLEKTIASYIRTTPTSPLLEARVQNIESHFNVDYAPRPPASLATRISLLEQHIMTLEREHPAWSALHFSQPGRSLGGMEKVIIKVKPQEAVTRKEVKIKAKEGKEKKEKSSGLGLTKGQSR